MNRTVSTDLFNLLDLIAAAEDYGYDRTMLMQGLLDIVKPLTDEEIEEYARSVLSDKQYTEEDYHEIKSRLLRHRDGR